MTNKLNQEIVLIVDDNAENHEIIGTFLEDLQITCDHAFDCIEAVTLCATKGNSHYSLILMDINLPHIDGIETTKKLRNAGVTSPIIAVTAISKSDSRKSKCIATFDSILHKPFCFQDLHHAISPYIKGTQPISQTNTADNFTVVSDSNICDFAQGISNMGGSERLFKKHAKNFVSNNFDLCARLSDMISDNQYQQAAFLCHSVKGLSGMLGFTSLYNNIINLEELMHTACGGTVHAKDISAILTLLDSDIRNICQIQF